MYSTKLCILGQNKYIILWNCIHSRKSVCKYLYIGQTILNFYMPVEQGLEHIKSKING